jgi:hypothetical protein
MPFDTPVMVMVEVPDAAVAPAVSVKMLVEGVLTGLNFAVTPVGIPEALKATLPLNPLMGTTVIVLVPGLPTPIVSVFGFADRLKLGVGEQVLKMKDVIFVDQSKVL